MKRSFTGLVAVAALLAAASAPTTAQSVIAQRGTEIDTTLTQSLNSKSNHDGDTFALVEKDGFFHKAPPGLKGATIEGHVENVQPASATHKASMSMIFDDVKLPDGSTAPISAKLESLSAVEPHSHHIRDIGLIAGGAVAGHMLGNKTGHKHGGLAGGAAGFALATHLKSDINVKSGSLIKLKLQQDLTPQTGA